MSKIIKSGSINLSEGKYELSSDIFISKERFFDVEKKHSAETVIFDDFLDEKDEKSGKENNNELENLDLSELDDVEEVEKEEQYSPEDLIEQAENAAIEIMDNAQEAADNLISEARKSARELEEEAIQNTNAVFEDAKNKGREEGYNEGYEEGKQEAEELKKQANILIDEALEIKENMQSKYKELLIDVEAEIIKLTLAISKKVIGKEIQDLDYIENLVSEAMKHLNYSTSLVLRVSEKDFDAASIAKPKILAMAERIESLDIKIDYALPEGSCLIDTSSGSIDASVQTQIDRIEEIFNNILLANESHLAEKQE